MPLVRAVFGTATASMKRVALFFEGKTGREEGIWEDPFRKNSPSSSVVQEFGYHKIYTFHRVSFLT
jgi:hypothetical protein